MISGVGGMMQGGRQREQSVDVVVMEKASQVVVYKQVGGYKGVRHATLKPRRSNAIRN
jgi:hypothetical protein